MLGQNKIATAIAAVGAAGVVGHVLLGPAVVPVAVALAGAVLVTAAFVYATIARKRESNRASEQPGQGLD
jgi:hypothetical protein